MNSSRLINGLIGAAIVAVLGLGWLLGVSPTLDQVTAAQLQTQAITDANSRDAAKITTLKKQFENLAQYESDLKQLQLSIPSERAIAEFLTEIRDLSASYGVTLTSLTVAGATAYQAAPDPAAPAAPAATPPAAVPDPSAAVPAASAASGMVTVPVVVMVSGTFDSVMAFTAAMQTGPRLFLVTSLSVASSSGDSSYKGTLGGAVFVLPGAPGSTPTSTPTATPAPSPTATPVPTGTSTSSPTTTP